MAVSTTHTPATTRSPKGIHLAWIILTILAVAQIVGWSISISAGIMVAPVQMDSE